VGAAPRGATPDAWCGDDDAVRAGEVGPLLEEIAGDRAGRFQGLPPDSDRTEDVPPGRCWRPLDGYLSVRLNRSMPEARTDRRREAGQRTQTRLVDAALDLLARRGEDGVTLREITDAAGANVAAVSYHFGSLKSLCDAAIEHALERYLDAQLEAVSTLGPESTIEESAAAFAQPMMKALALGGRELAVMRIVARSGIDPPERWARLSPRFDRIRADVVRVLKANLPDVKRQELTFRTRCAAGMLNWIVLAPVGAELTNKSEKQVERLLVPVLAGAFRGTPPA
jgi:AcrR family transcriptional regulator